MPNQTVNIQKVRNGGIDFWKFIFSILVVQFHSSNLTKIKTTPFIGAAIAVEFFFLVSGYLMAASISRYKETDIVTGRDSRKFLFHKIRGLDTKLAKQLLTILELACYLGVIVWSYNHKGSQMDFVMLFLFAVGMSITFSEQSILSSFFNKPLVYFFGKISFSVYLAHDYWSHALLRMYPEQTYAQLYPKYILAVIVTATVIYMTAQALRKSAPAFLKVCRRIFLETEQVKYKG